MTFVPRTMLFPKPIDISDISNIKFTPRELDVIACIANNRGNKKIAYILAISTKTVSNHINNIMQKLNANSREYIIDLVEKSGLAAKAREHYIYLLRKTAFAKAIQQISSILGNNTYTINLKSNSNFDAKLFIAKLQQNLKSITINIDPNLRSIIRLEDKTSTCYYTAALFVLTKLQKNSAITHIYQEFTQEYNNLKSTEYNQSKTIKNKASKLCYTHKYIIISILLACFTNAYWLYNYYVKTQQIYKDYSSVYPWNAPYLPNNFIARKDLTASIENQFRKKSSTTVGLYGLSGTGKTYLALNYIYHSKKPYQFKFWLTANDSVKLKLDYLELGETMQLFAKGYPEKTKIALVKKWLCEQKNILLVFDNAPDQNTIADFIPQNKYADIIITSRNPNIAGAIEVDLMQENEAINLMKSIIKTPFIEEDYKLLAKTLTYLPIALAQASSYIEESQISIGKYLELSATEQQQSNFAQFENANSNNTHIYKSWQLTLNKLASNDKDTIRLLQFIAFCHFNNIPRKLLIQYLYQDTNNSNEIKLNNLLLHLKKYSLIKLSENTVAIHHLLQDCIKAGLTSEEKAHILHQAVNAFLLEKSRDYDMFCAGLLAKANLAQLKQKRIVLGAKNDHIYLRSLNTQIEELLKYKQYMQKQDYLDLLNILVHFVYTSGDFHRAKELSTEALNSIVEHNIKDVYSIAFQLRYLGRIYKRIWNNSLGRIYLTTAYNKMRDIYATENHYDVAKTLTWLGAAERDLGNLKLAKEIFLKSSNLMFNVFKSYDHIEIAHNLGWIATADTFLGNLSQAKSLLEESIKFKANYYKTHDHIFVDGSLLDLAKVELQLNNYDRCEELAHKSLQFKNDYFGPTNKETSYALDVMAELAAKRGNYQLAKKILQKSIAIKTNYYGSEQNYEVLRNLKYLKTIEKKIDNSAVTKLQHKISIIESNLTSEDKQKLDATYELLHKLNMITPLNSNYT